MTVGFERGAETRRSLASLAPLFLYPDNGIDERLDDAAFRVRLIGGDAARHLDLFLRDIRAMETAEQQMTYTATFDLAPTCSPYAGAHIFGDDNAARARLVIALRTVFRSRGFEADEIELPDHISELLRAVPILEGGEEWEEMRDLILLPALKKMSDSLSDSSNPYRHLIAAAIDLVSARGAL